ncbi:hypothetical protein IMSAG013_00379 [Clostridiales bacterium]|nr:DUF4830 domain-containing protein [Clostridiales bacterium]GFI55337.1 hypothetical protein IMSAG013_00379 [Clostridiales bacterium]
MFVCSLKASSLKFAGVIGIAVAALIALLILMPPTQDVSAGAILEDNGTINFEKIKTNENRLEFLSQFGWEAGKDAVEEVEVRIPSDFDKVMNAYNEVQKAQGLDLAKYKGKTATRYTYQITNYPDYDGTVYANIIVYKNRVIGGDICSSDVSGFIHGFALPTQAE